MLLFQLTENFYALPTSSAIEIQRTLNVYPLANSPPYYIGATSLRGVILPILDLEAFFHPELKDSTKSSSSDTRDIYIHVEIGNRTVLFKVKEVIGTFFKPEVEKHTNLMDLPPSLDSDFFTSAFMYKNMTVTGLNLDKIVNIIQHDLGRLHSNFKVNNKALISTSEITEEQALLNIDYQLDTSMIVQDGKPELKRLPKVKSPLFTGTSVKVMGNFVLIPNRYIKEIFILSGYKEIPNTPKFVLGAISYRGRIISILDLPTMLGREKKIDEQEIDKIIIVEISDNLFALSVDQILGMQEFDKSEVRNVNVSGISEQYYIFDGVLIDQQNKIHLLLNVEYLFQRFSQSKLDETFFNPTIFFDNPEIEFFTHHEKEQDGILFKDEDNYFYIDSSNIKHIISPTSIIMKDYEDSILRGAAAHRSIVPVVDFSEILNKDIRREKNAKKSAGIIITDPEREIDIGILIEEISGHLTQGTFETYEQNLGMSENILPTILSGFFSIKSDFGIVINSKELIEEAETEIKTYFNIDKIDEFKNTLSPSEIEFFDKEMEELREIENLIDRYQKEDRLDYFIFSWGELNCGFDVEYIRRVVDLTEIQDLGENYHPFLGIMIKDTEKIPILDLSSELLTSGDPFKLTPAAYLSWITIDNNDYLIPVDEIYGVISTFKEDLKSFEDGNIFKDPEKTCKKTFYDERFTSSIKILDFDYLSVITKKHEPLLKEIVKQTNSKKEN